MIRKLEKIAKEMTLLFVDDNRDFCETNKAFLEDIFKSVDYALNGQDALDLYKHNSYNLVITDLNMPQLNGLLLIREIYKIDPRQPIIVLSAYDEREYLSHLYSIEIEHFLLKPVDTKLLIEEIYKTLQAQREKELQD